MNNRLTVKPGSWISVYIPEGYSVSDFQSYEVYEDYVIGILYSGEGVELTAPTQEETLTWVQKLKEAWSNLW